MGIEEMLFYEIMGSSPYGKNIFTSPLEVKKVYINNVFYGIYLQAPTLDAEFLKTHGIANPHEDKTCIIQAEKLILDTTEALQSNLFTTQDHFTFSNLRKVFEIEHGEKEYCFDKIEKLIYQLQDGFAEKKYTTENIDTDSVIQRGLANIIGSNRDAFTHNYLLIFHEDTWYMGSRDTEHFKGCSNNNYEDYMTKPKYQNALFQYVLEEEIQKNKESLLHTQGVIRNILCDKKIYNSVKKEDLQYIVFDRYIRNAGHLTASHIPKLPYMQRLEDVYNGEKNFADLLASYYTEYRSYFGFTESEKK